MSEYFDKLIKENTISYNENTYGLKIPIVITLSYGANLLKIPVNPESLSRNIPSNSRTVNIEGIGEVSIPTTPKLSKISIKSFFWQDRNILPSSAYISWLLAWQKSKKPAKMIITKLNYSMQVTCENFIYDTKAGEEDDVYYELELQEYRNHGAILVSNSKVNTSVFETLTNLNIPIPFLIDIPRPPRTASKKKPENPYIVNNYRTLISITKSIRGNSSDWKSLYESNKKTLGDSFSSNSSIPKGTKLILPEGWL